MSDRLDRALRALREEKTGENTLAEATLDRVLADRARAKRATIRRARIWIPIAAVLAISTAAVARWEAGWRSHPPVGEGELATPTKTPPGPPALPLAATPTPAPSEEAVPPSSPLPVPMPPPLSRPLSPPKSARVSGPIDAPAAPPPVPVAIPSASAEETAPAAPEEGATEADVYARAHRLHFDGTNPSAALAAWDDYLARFPSGRFAPDARYNRAIDLLKAHRYAEASRALQPFADGAYGGYHRDDARELLRTLP